MFDPRDRIEITGVEYDPALDDVFLVYSPPPPPEPPATAAEWLLGLVLLGLSCSALVGLIALLARLAPTLCGK